MIRDVTGHGLDRPFQELLDGIAPPPPFPVPKGFPLPWEVATAYRFMITMYKLNFNGAWELSKPRVPDFVIVPPASDFTNLFQPPDFSGVNGDNPIEDVCDVFIALVEWIVKEVAAAIKLAGDIIKMLVSPNTYAIRLALYELAHEDLGRRDEDARRDGAHGHLLSARRAAVRKRRIAAAERDRPPADHARGHDRRGVPAGAGRRHRPAGEPGPEPERVVSHSVRDGRMPFYPVLSITPTGTGPTTRSITGRGPTRCSASSRTTGRTSITTPTETYDPSKSDPTRAPRAPFKPMRPGPYPERTTPDQVFFRTDGGVDVEGRGEYESAQSPWQTDLLNERFIGKARGDAEPARRPGAVLRVPDRPIGQSD